MANIFDTFAISPTGQRVEAKIMNGVTSIKNALGGFSALPTGYTVQTSNEIWKKTATGSVKVSSHNQAVANSMFGQIEETTMPKGTDTKLDFSNANEMLTSDSISNPLGLDFSSIMNDANKKVSEFLSYAFGGKGGYLGFTPSEMDTMKKMTNAIEGNLSGNQIDDVIKNMFAVGGGSNASSSSSGSNSVDEQINQAQKMDFVGWIDKNKLWLTGIVVSLGVITIISD